jgi:hypothetical protein
MHKEAVSDFSEVIRLNPKNAHAYFRRAFSSKALKVSTFFVITADSNLNKQLTISNRLKG